MSLTRLSIIRGPAVVIYTTAGGSATTLFSKGDIQLRMANQTFDIATSLFGVVDKRTNQRSVEITFTPTGELTTAFCGVLWPHGSKNPGDSLIGAGNPTIQIIPKTGYQYTFYGAVVTKQPQMMLSTTKTLIGSVTFTAIGKEGVLWSTAGSLYDQATANFGTYAFSASNIRTCPYSGSWGSGPVLALADTKDGWTVDFNVSTTPVEADSFGIVDYTVGDNVATAHCTPLTVSESTLTAFLNLQGSGADRGQSLLSGNDLAITPTTGTPVGSANVTLKNCSILQVGYDYDLQALRVPQIQFTSIRTLVTNALVPAYTIAAN